jgi:hypothetical protein
MNTELRMHGFRYNDIGYFATAAGCRGLSLAMTVVCAMIF